MTNLSDLYPSGTAGTVMPEYAANNTYPVNAIVSYQGIQYKSLINGNQGNQPDTSPDAWQEYLYDAARMNYDGNEGMLIINDNIKFKAADAPEADGMTMTIGSGGIIELQQTGDTTMTWSAEDTTSVVLTTTPNQLLSITLDEDVAVGEGSYAISGKVDNADGRARDLIISIYQNTTLLKTGTISIERDVSLYLFSFTGALETALANGDEIKVEFSADQSNELTLRGDVYATFARVKKVVPATMLILLGNNHSVQKKDRYRWDDEAFMLIAMHLDSFNGKLDYDYEDKGILFPDNTGISNDKDKLHFSYELKHRYKLDGLAHPHIHWLQTTQDRPNWLFRWRVWKNGEDVGVWHNMSVTTDLYPAPAVGARKIQISHGDYIDLAPFDLHTSDFLELELCRDCDNDSGLFPGGDPINGDVLAKAFAPHLQVSGFGTKQEWDTVP